MADHFAVARLGEHRASPERWRQRRKTERHEETFAGAVDVNRA